MQTQKFSRENLTSSTLGRSLLLAKGASAERRRAFALTALCCQFVVPSARVVRARLRGDAFRIAHFFRHLLGAENKEQVCPIRAREMALILHGKPGAPHPTMWALQRVCPRQSRGDGRPATLLWQGAHGLFRRVDGFSVQVGRRVLPDS